MSCGALVENVPLERWIQLMIGVFKIVNLAWVYKFAVIGYTWLFVYESVHSYEEGMHVTPKPAMAFFIADFFSLFEQIRPESDVS